MLNAAILTLLLAATPARSASVRAAFIASHAPPPWCATYVLRDGILYMYSRSGACDVDHICPLACGGKDSVENMQWLDAKENRSKGADCTKCEVKK